MTFCTVADSRGDDEPDLRQNSPTPKTPPLWLSKRLVVVMVLFSCTVVSQILRNHINVTIVQMTSIKSIVEGNTTIVQPADFDWTSTTVALVISIYSYGGLFSFFGGFIVNKFGGSVTCSTCMIISGIATILHPAALRIDFSLFLLCRFITGVSQTFVYVSVIEIYSRWFPKQERSKLVSFSFNGSNAGLVLSYLISGYLAQRWGWSIVFYVTGVLPLIVAVICLFAVSNRPSQDKRISKVELQYILEGTNCNEGEKTNIPYKSMFKSKPLWTLCCVAFTFTWISTNLELLLPLYVEDLTHKNAEAVGWISCIPRIFYTLIYPFAGMLMDYCHNNGIITSNKMHKIIICDAFYSANTFFIISTFTSSLTVKSGLFVLIDVLMSPVALIIEINTVGISDHAGLVGSLMAFVFSLGGITALGAAGFIIPNHSVDEWNNGFYLTSLIAVLGALIFHTFGSSESQNWSTPSINKDEDEISDKI